MNKYFSHPMVPAMFLIAFVFYYFNAVPIFWFPDSAWHISTGDLILSSGLPQHDIWSYTAGDTRWYNISWMWDIFIAMLKNITGPKGLYMLGVILSALIVAMLTGSMLSRRNLKDYAIFTTAIITIFVIWEFVNLRPALASAILIIIYHRLLHKSRDKWQYLIPLPFVMALWVNLHGMFIVGFTMIGAYFIEAYIRKNSKWLLALFVCGSVCAAACLVNPYGWEIAIATSRTLSSVVTKYISEWQPFVFDKQFGATLALLVFLLVSNPRDEEVPLADKILTFAWLFAALFSRRHFITFILVAAPYIACQLGKTGNPKPFFNMEGKNYHVKSFMFSFIVTIAMLLPNISGFLLQKDFINGTGKVPIKSIFYIKEHYPDKRFLNDYSIGGHIIFYGAGTIPVFVDGRAGTAYSEEVLKEQISFLLLEDGWEKIIDKYNIEGIIVKKNHKFAEAYKYGAYHNWEKVFEDDVAEVFVKKG